MKARYRQVRIGDVAIKEQLDVVINNRLAPIRTRLATDASKTGFLEAVFRSGTLSARDIARTTLMEVKKAMGLDYFRQPVTAECDGSRGYI